MKPGIQMTYPYYFGVTEASFAFLDLMASVT